MQNSKGIPNNQPLQNNQNVNVNQTTFNSQQQVNADYQPITNQMNMQQPTPQPMNSFESENSNQNFNSKPPKKNHFGLIIGIIATSVIAGVGALLLFNRSSNQGDNNGITSNNANVVYSDSSRNINSTYTFDEAVSKFAFKEYETTLIFQQKDNTKLSSISFGNFNTVVFYYEKNGATYFHFQFNESSSTNVNEFVNNFKNGVLGGGTKQLSFENINILESNDEYAFISCQETGNSSYNYYFAKQIGGKVFYAHYNSLFEVDDSEKVGYQEAINKGKSEMLIGFKELFSALSIDDNKEPYIVDKIMNVPNILNKKIENYEFIDNIQVVNPKVSTLKYRNYIKGTVTLYNLDTKRLDIYYDAEKLYNKVEWTKELSSKLKYSEEDNFFGIKDNNITQMFQISTTENINNEKDFNEYLNGFFN